MATETVQVDVKRNGSSLGVASLILGALAFPICWIPLLGVLGMPLSGLGILLGSIGVVVALVRRGASIGFPIAGVAVSGLAFVVAGSMTSAMAEGIASAGDALAAERTSRNRTNQVVVTDGNSDSEESTIAEDVASPAKSAGTIDPVWALATQPVRQGDIEVRIASAAIGKVELGDAIFRDRKYWSESELLSIAVEVTNHTAAKKVDYRSWVGGDFSLSRDFATLGDEHGNSYKRIDFGFGNPPVGRVEKGSIRPGESLTDVLVFEQPVDAAESLRLELPAPNFGGEGMLRIEIPKSMVTR